MVGARLGELSGGLDSQLHERESATPDGRQPRQLRRGHAGDGDTADSRLWSPPRITRR